MPSIEPTGRTPPASGSLNQGVQKRSGAIACTSTREAHETWPSLPVPGTEIALSRQVSWAAVSSSGLGMPAAAASRLVYLQGVGGNCDRGASAQSVLSSPREVPRSNAATPALDHTTFPPPSFAARQTVQPFSSSSSFTSPSSSNC